MELKYTLELEDYVALQMTFWNSKRYIRRARIFITLCVFITVIVVSFSDNANTATFVVCLFIGVVISTIVNLIFPKYIKLVQNKSFQGQMKKIYKEKIGQESVVAIAEEGLACKDQFQEDIVKYSAAKDLVESDRHFFISFKQGSVLIFPKEKINADELNAFIEEVSRRTGLEIKDQPVW